jgi:hypothetical protein
MSSPKEGVRMLNKNLFKTIEQATGVKMEDIIEVAKSFQHADLSDKHTIRKLIRQVSKLANKPVSKELEDKITNIIMYKKVPSVEEIKKEFK